MKDLTESVKATLYERASNPFYSAFIFSWLVCNWRIPMIIVFGDDEVSRIEYIQSYIENLCWNGWFQMLILPLLSSLFLLLLLPRFTNSIYPVILEYKKDRVNKKVTSEHKHILHSEKALDLYQELGTIKAKLASTIEDKNKEIIKLNKEIGKALNDVAIKVQTIEKLSKSSSQIEYEYTLEKSNRIRLEDINKQVNHIVSKIISNESSQNAVLVLINKYELNEISKTMTSIEGGNIKRGNNKDTIFRDLNDLKLLSFESTKEKPEQYYKLNEKGVNTKILIDDLCFHIGTENGSTKVLIRE